MKRSSSKLLSKAGSIRNINKVGFKFKIDLQIESVDHIVVSDDVCITWHRGNKLLSTKSVAADKATRTAHFNNEVLSHHVTLFKKKKEGSKFEDKTFQLSVRSNSQSGKVITRMLFNISDHVDVNPVSKRLAAPFKNGSRLIMTFSSSFLGEAKVRQGGSKGSTGSTVDDDMSMTSTDDLGDLNDFADLDVAELGEEEDPYTSTTTPSSVPPRSAPIVPSRRAPAPVSQEDFTASTSIPLTQISQPARQPLPPQSQGPRAVRKPSAPSPGREPLRKGRSDDHVPGPELSSVGSGVRSGGGLGLGRGPAFGKSRNRSDAEVSLDGDAPSKADVDMLRKENRNLRRKNDDLSSRVASLERQLDEFHDNDNSQAVDELTEQNKDLRAYVEDLEIKLKREPVYTDVVRDLREAKMALAIVTLEKDELLQEVRRLRK